MENTSCEVAELLYNYSPIYNHLCSSGEQPSSALWYSRPMKHPLSAHLRSRPGKAPTFRAPLSRPKSKLPTRQSVSSLWSPGCLLLITQLGRVSPYGYEDSPPRSGLWQLWCAACRNRPTNHFISNLDHYHSFPVLGINLLPFGITRWSNPIIKS